MVSSPHTHSGKLTAHIMLWAILAMMPAFFTQIYYFGFGVVLQSALAIGTAIIAEFIAIKLRGKTAQLSFRFQRSPDCVNFGNGYSTLCTLLDYHHWNTLCSFIR